MILRHHIPPIWLTFFRAGFGDLGNPGTRRPWGPLAPANDRPLFASFGDDLYSLLQCIGSDLAAPVFALQSGNVTCGIRDTAIFSTRTWTGFANRRDDASPSCARARCRAFRKSSL